jgi:hypothetical protein
MINFWDSTNSQAVDQHKQPVKDVESFQHANMLDLTAQSTSLVRQQRSRKIVSDLAQRMRVTVLSMQAKNERAQHGQDFGTALQAHE